MLLDWKLIILYVHPTFALGLRETFDTNVSLQLTAILRGCLQRVFDRLLPTHHPP